MNGPYDDLPDVLPVATAPMKYRGQTNYDSRMGDADQMYRRFQEQHTTMFARALMKDPKFFFIRPYSPGSLWHDTLNFEAIVLTEKEWAEKLADAYNKGVLASNRMRCA